MATTGNPEPLARRRCEPCRGGTASLAPARISALLAQLPGWRLAADATAILRQYRFKGFGETMAFINSLAWLSHRQGHHPDFRAGYDWCEVRYTTHATGGLTENDFICAARLDALLED